MIFMEYEIADIITTYVLLFLCSIVFIAAGIILLIKKDLSFGKSVFNKLSKKSCVIYALIEIILAVSSLSLGIVGLFDMENVVIMFIAAGILIALIIFILVFRIISGRRK